MNAFQRNFVNEIKRCDELERKLNFFEDELSDLDGCADGEKKAIRLNHKINDRHLKLDDLEVHFTQSCLLFILWMAVFLICRPNLQN